VDKLKGITVTGVIVADTFGATDDGKYVFGDFAGLGWGSRFSCPAELLPLDPIGRALQRGEDVEVVVTANASAVTNPRGQTQLKLQLLTVEVVTPEAAAKTPARASSSNGS
jgi:hypothetical protein